MVAGYVAGAKRAELNSLDRQWRDGENGPVGRDLHISVWKFTAKYAGEDLGHDVCLPVVRELNRLQGRLHAALSDDLSAYLYESCRNARKDQRRQTRKYVPFLEEHIPQVSHSSDSGEHQGHDGNPTNRWLDTFERCRRLLSAPIAEPLGLDDFDLAATLGSTSSCSDAIKKRIHRAKSKRLLAFGAAAVIGYPTPKPSSVLISRLSPSFRGGPWEQVLAIAPRLRNLNPDGSRASAVALAEAAQHLLSTFARGREGIEAFKGSYTWLRTAALLSFEVAADGYGKLKSTLYHHENDAQGRRALVSDQPAQKLIKTGAKVVSHGRYVRFQMAEVAVPRQIFQEILSLIARLRATPAPA
jgi:hypothetical protein